MQDKMVGSDDRFDVEQVKSAAQALIEAHADHAEGVAVQMLTKASSKEFAEAVLEEVRRLREAS